MKLVSIVGAVALLAATASSCAQAGAGSSSGLEVELTLDPAPAREGPVRLELVLTDSDGDPLEGAAVEVEGNMNHAGMVPELATATELGSGRYEADIEFTMGGDWFVVVRARTAEGQRLERTIDVPGVATE